MDSILEQMKLIRKFLPLIFLKQEPLPLTYGTLKLYFGETKRGSLRGWPTEEELGVHFHFLPHELPGSVFFHQEVH